MRVLLERNAGADHEAEQQAITHRGTPESPAAGQQHKDEDGRQLGNFLDRYGEPNSDKLVLDALSQELHKLALEDVSHAIDAPDAQQPEAGQSPQRNGASARREEQYPAQHEAVMRQAAQHLARA